MKSLNSIKHIIPRKMVNRAITQIYEYRIDSLSKSKEDNKELKLYEFVYDLFIKKYGLKHVAEKKYT